MRHVGSFALTLMLAALPLYACAGSDNNDTDAGPTQDAGTETMTGAQLRSNVRDAFVAEAEWMRTYGVAALDGTPDAPAAFTRLNETEAQIVQQVAPFAGDDRAAQLGQLLHARATLFADVVTGVASKAAPTASDPQVALDANAQQISDFFAQLAPAAFRGDGGDALKQADRSMIAGLEARSTGDMEKAVADFDAAQASSVLFADATGVALSATFGAQLAQPTTNRTEDALAINLHTMLADQAFWMRSYIVGYMADKPVQPELDRSVKATIDVGDAFATYFGKDVGAQIQFYVHQDTTDAIAFVYALDQNDQSTVNAIATKWNTDADAFAQFLATTTTNVDLKAVQTILRTNVDRESAMIEARAAKQWDAEAADYQMVLANRQTLADVLATAMLSSLPHMR